MQERETDSACTNGSRKRATASRPAWAVPALLVICCLFLSFRITAPWQYRHDDNGAWFSAIARTHLLRGLAETKGQDFFLERATNERRPYLHHPPFISLYLAAVFRVTGMDTPTVARISVAVLHLLSVLVFAGIARRLFGGAVLPVLWAVSVHALAPMSVFFGKMPNHEVPGLLFFNLAIYLSICAAQDGAHRRRYLAAAVGTWFLVPFASWHAALCGIAFVLIAPAFSEREQRNRFRLVSSGALLTALALVVIQLLWAGNWQMLSSQHSSLQHWVAAPPGQHAVAAWGGNLLEAIRTGRRFYANTPWVLAVGWACWLAVRALRRSGRISRTEMSVLSTGTGSLLYCLLFPRAVQTHAYQLFYFLPFVALSSALAMAQLHDLLQRRRQTVALLFTVIMATVGILSTFRLLHRLYREPAPYAVKTTRELAEQFY